jgi:DNA-nicking Smr family endonuclease
MKLTSLKDLQQVQRHLAEAQARAAAQDAARREAERRLQAERDLFTRAVGAVKALPDARKAQLKLPPPEPVAVQQQRDDQAVLREAISDEFDVGTLLEADEQLSFRRPGIGPDVTRRLRRGQWSIQRQLDLHGLRATTRAKRWPFSSARRSSATACAACAWCMARAWARRARAPVLKSRVQGWLVQKTEVLAFVPRPAPQTAAHGALLVLLPNRPRRCGCGCWIHPCRS